MMDGKKKIGIAVATAIVIFEAFLVFILAQPTINFVSDSPDPVEVPGYNNITANITEADKVFVEIHYPDCSLMGNFSMNYVHTTYVYVYGVATWYFNRTYGYPDPLGKYEYYIKAYNSTGWSVIGPYNFTLQDTTPPSSYIDTISPYWNNAPLIITVSATDNYDVASVSLYYRHSTDNLTWGSWSLFAKDVHKADGWAFLFDFPAGEGYYEFYSIANDTSGNAESKSMADENAGYDVTPPLTTCSLNPSTPDGENGWYTTPVNVTLFAVDPDGDLVVYTNYRIDGGNWQTYTAPFTISEEGSHLLEFYSADDKGNVEPIKNVTIKIDGTEPFIMLQRPTMGYLYLFDRQIWPLASGSTVIIGRIVVRVVAYDTGSDINNVSFYVNGILQTIDTLYPYEWIWRGDAGWRYLHAVAYNGAGLKAETYPIYVFIVSL